MKLILPMLIVFVVVISILKSTTHQPPIEGCYIKNEEITSFVSEESDIKQSYLNLSKAADEILVEGLVWGANFHICSVSSPSEDSEGPLRMRLSDGRFVYRYSEPEYDINCELELIIQGDQLHISDSNSHCSEYVFYCGVHAGLDGVKLVKQGSDCPTDT